MNLNRGVKRSQLFVFLLVPILWMASASADLKPNILATCSSLLSGNQDKNQIALARIEIQKYLDQQNAMLMPDVLAKSDWELRKERKGQLASIEHTERLAKDMAPTSDPNAPVVSAEVKHGHDEILDFISKQAEDVNQIQHTIDSANPPLSLRNYISNVSAGKSVVKLFFPALFTALSVPTAHVMYDAMVLPGTTYETGAVLMGGVLFFATARKMLIRMGKTVAALAVPSLRADLEVSSRTRTDEEQNFFSEVSTSLKEGPNHYSGRHIMLSQPISSSLHDHCREFMAGDLTSENVMKGLKDSVRFKNSIIPKRHSFSVDVIFQYVEDEPTLTIVGRCK